MDIVEEAELSKKKVCEILNSIAAAIIAGRVDMKSMVLLVLRIKSPLPMVQCIRS